MGTRTQGRPSNKIGFIIVDDNLSHANTASCLLSKLDFQVTVYTSPVEALKVLKDHQNDFGLALVAVNMKEMDGFQFLKISRELHTQLQVIMMSADTTWCTMKRSVEFGARFLVKKPLDGNTINNIWQHLDLKFHRIEKIKESFRDLEGKTDGGFKSQPKFGEGSSKQKAALMWTPFLQRKFLQALELLGEGATPKNIQLIMDVNSIGRKQISAHLQKHRKKIEKENAKCSNGASNSQASNDADIKPADRSNELMPSDQTESTDDEPQGNRVYKAMRRAMQLGTIFDESQLSNDAAGRRASEGEVAVMGGDESYASGDKNTVCETHNAESTRKLMNKGDSDEQASYGDDKARVVKLVTYSDSEDDEML
ncbi:hypothetical protein BS78_06G053100 [Paspalum vaginatum]|nr:hypothetical protein BS78_06G053100 [Paspalum vaginatum]